MHPRRVLIAQPYGLGDLLFITPVLRALRLMPTVEKVDLLLGSRSDAVVRNNPHADEIFSIDKDLFHRQGKYKSLIELSSLGTKLRRNRYDLLLDYSLRGEYAFCSQFFLGIHARVGFDYKNRGFFHTKKLPIPNGFAGRHVVDSFCDLAEAAGILVEDRFLEFYPSEQDRQEASDKLEKLSGKKEAPFLVLSPGGGESWGKDAHFKRWPAPFFSDFILRLSQNNSFERVLIVGSSSERELAGQIIKDLSLPAANLCGQIPLGQVAAVIEKAALFVGNDGGLLHLAHALRTPVIGFYGPVPPEVYGPYPASDRAIAVYKEDLECRPCYHRFRYHASCVGRECLQALTPQYAFDFLEKRNFFTGRLSQKRQENFSPKCGGE